MMIPNRCYRIPPFSVKLEITRVEIFPAPCSAKLEQKAGSCGYSAMSQRPCQGKIKKIFIIGFPTEAFGNDNLRSKSLGIAGVIDEAHRHGV